MRPLTRPWCPIRRYLLSGKLAVNSLFRRRWRVRSPPIARLYLSTVVGGDFSIWFSPHRLRVMPGRLETRRQRHGDSRTAARRISSTLSSRSNKIKSPSTIARLNDRASLATRRLLQQGQQHGTVLGGLCAKFANSQRDFASGSQQPTTAFFSRRANVRCTNLSANHVGSIV